MPVTVTPGPKILIDVQALAKKLAPAILGRVLEREGRGIGSDGKPHREYAPFTKERYAAMGERSDIVDLRLTGGLLNSVHLKSTQVAGGIVTLTFGPDTGTSPQVSPPVRGKALARRTGGRGPPHNLVGLWIHKGNPATHLPPRPWLGLSPEDNRWVTKLIESMGVFRT